MPRSKDSTSDQSVNESATTSQSDSLSGGGGGGGGGAHLPAKSQCLSANTLSGLSDVDAESCSEVSDSTTNCPTTALGQLGQAIDQAIASMTAAAAEHADYDVPKPPRSLKVPFL